MAIGLAVLAGLLVGGGLGEGFGALAGALLGWLLVRSVQQGREIDRLKQALGEAARVPESASAPLDRSGLPEVARMAGASGFAPEAGRTQSAAMSPSSAWVRTVEPVAEPAVAQRQPVEPPVAAGAARGPSTGGAVSPAWLVALKASVFGGNTIVKAGVAILFLGLAFLAKYASERVTLPVEFRLAGIALVALVLLVVGWRLRQRQPGYAQALQGGAVAVLYLTLFVAFRFYGVVGAAPVFALMVVVAALAAALAVLQDARSLAVIGAVGGFATPLLVSTGSGNPVALFSYYLVLDLGIAAVAWFRTWRALNLVGFGFTYGIATAWGVLDYSPERYASSQAFLAAFFLLFIAMLLMPARRGHPGSVRRGEASVRRADWVNGTLLFGLPTVTFALQYGLVQHQPFGVALSALALAAFYLLLAARLRSQPGLGLAFDAALAIATVFLTLVIPFALDARSTAGAWALEGAGLVWLGLRQARRLPRAFGYALILLASLFMAWGDLRMGSPRTVFNAHLLNALLLAAGALVAAWALHRHGPQQPAGRLHAGPALTGEGVAEPLLIGWACVWMIAAASVQIEHFVEAGHELAAWLAVFSAVALGWAGLARGLAWPRAGVVSMAHAPLVLGALALSAALLPHPLRAGGAWAWPLALGVHGLVLRSVAPSWPAAVRRATHAMGLWVLAGLGALLGRAITRGWGDLPSAWPWLGWMVVPAALLLAVTRRPVLQRWPLRAEPAAYSGLGAGVLAAGLWAWTLAANAVSDGSAAPLPYLPLLNPLDLGVAWALAAAALWLKDEAAAPWLAAKGRPLAAAGLAAAAFVWLNAMLIRAFHHLGGVPFHLNGWMESFAVQTGLTLLWTTTALGLMWGSARQAARLPWAVGAALLGAVVLKLVAVDLSGSGTVTRIVSFIGVGVLMLVIGYVAPWPAQRESARAAG